MQLSIVTTLYQSELYIEEFYRRCIEAAAKWTESFEIVFVDDGSSDNSLAMAVDLAKADKRVRVVQLSRNFGHHHALMTGLRHCCGEKVFLIDSDLEEPPELLHQFWEQWRTDASIDVVYGIQKRRKGNLFERVSGSVFYRLLDAIAGIELPRNSVIARLMSREFVDALLEHEERSLMIGGLFVITGFNQCQVLVDKSSKGTSTYNIVSKVKQAIDGITSFSAAPLHFFFWFGLFVAIGALGYGLYLMILYFQVGIASEGWTSVMVSLWFFSGCILLALGTIGIYVSKIHIEVKNRPYTIVKKIWGRTPDGKNDES